MTFTPNFTAQESSDGKTVTFTNTSNFGTNDQNYQIADFTVNKLELKDAYGSVIQEINFPTSGADTNVIRFTLPSDIWIEAKLILSGPASFTKILKFPFYKMFMLKSKGILRNNIRKQVLFGDFSKSQFFKDVAVDSIAIGDGAEFQDNIDAANKFLSKTS